MAKSYKNSQAATGPARRVRRAPEEARRLILETARTLIAQTGPEGLRLQDIAAAAGISHPLILHHFGSRAGLVRALTQQAASELKDRLVTAMTRPEYSIAEQLDRVFAAFRGGLAQRLAWLAVEDPGGGEPHSALTLREIADALCARRLAAAGPGAAAAREDAEALIHLIAITAFGEAMYGAQLRRSAGIADDAESASRFREWFAQLIRAHGERQR
jgi:TetR/AcrR family transcriptional regulator, repressor for neighboring sulfatase